MHRNAPFTKHGPGPGGARVRQQAGRAVPTGSPHACRRLRLACHALVAVGVGGPRVDRSLGLSNDASI